MLSIPIELFTGWWFILWIAQSTLQTTGAWFLLVMLINHLHFHYCRAVIPRIFEVHPCLLWYKTSMYLTLLQQLESPAIFCICPPTSKISVLWQLQDLSMNMESNYLPEPTHLYIINCIFPCVFIPLHYLFQKCTCTVPTVVPLLKLWDFKHCSQDN